MRSRISLFTSRGARLWLAGSLLPLVPVVASAQFLHWNGRAPQEGVPGLTVTLRQPKSIVIEAVQQIAEDGVIHGTWVFEKDKTLSGAHAVQESEILGGSEGAEKTFYKVAESVVAPRFFKASADVGNITVRYLVQGTGPGTTRLQVDAVFTEYGRKKAHPSTGVVEASEYQSIETELDKMQAVRSQHEAELGAVSSSAGGPADEPPAPSATALPTNFETAATNIQAAAGEMLPGAQEADSGQAVAQLQLQISQLRHKVEMRIKSDQAPLKSAPFNGSATLASLSGGADVLILIITPHWYGIETQTGQHGWVHGSQLEPLP